MGAQFEILKNSAGKFYWRFKAANGEILAHSETYETKQGCVNGIESIKGNAATAATQDLTS